MTEGIRRYATGSIRSSDCDDLRYDCISPHGLYRLAKRYALGARKYGDHNYLLGQPISEVYNHMFDHMRKYLQGDKTEDNMAAIAWGAFTIMEYEESHPEMQNMPRHNPECWPKPQAVAQLDDTPVEIALANGEKVVTPAHLAYALMGRVEDAIHLAAINGNPPERRDIDLRNTLRGYPVEGVSAEEIGALLLCAVPSNSRHAGSDK
jgi:hypothetical protein